MRVMIADYALTPNRAIIDANFVDNMPKGLTAASGFDAYGPCRGSLCFGHGDQLPLVFSTNSAALEAIKQVFRYLPRA